MYHLFCLVGMVSEPILSLDWLSGKCLVCSSRQHLRVYDLREEDSKQAQLELFTKAVYCARVDPHNEQRIASFFEVNNYGIVVVSRLLIVCVGYYSCV